MKPKALADNAFQTSTVHGAARALLGHGEAESWVGESVLAKQHRKACASPPLRGGKHLAILAGAGKPKGPGKGLIRGCGQLGASLCAVQGAKRTRPFARRALKTRLPFLVALRARKPCVLARLRRLGWKVRFMIAAPRVVVRDSCLSPVLKGAET
jgi:hypothetical protein